jgi:tRNA-modifying protein YgfZ
MQRMATLLNDRALLRLSGPEVRGFLQGLVTNDVFGPLPAWTGLLSPQGKVLFDFLLWPDPAGSDDVLLDCEARAAASLKARLSMYRLRRAIEIVPEPDLAVHWSIEGGDIGAPDPRHPDLGRRWLQPSGTDAEAAEEQWRAHRLSLGIAEGQAELGVDRTLWLEANAAELNGVSFAKGCYVGQENTARMNWRSRVARRLVVVRATEDPGVRANIWYPALGLAVERRRVADLPAGDVIVPVWLENALNAGSARAEEA